MSRQDHPGGPPASETLHKLVDLLEDGEWHVLEDILAEAGKLVPPGVAIRRAEKRRAATAGSAEERVRETAPDRLIAMGKRVIVMDTIAGGSRGYFELTPARFPRDPERQVRLLQMPPRVARDRRLAERDSLFRASDAVETLLTTASPRMYVHDLTRPQLERLTIALLERLQDSNALELEGDTSHAC